MLDRAASHDPCASSIPCRVTEGKAVRPSNGPDFRGEFLEKSRFISAPADTSPGTPVSGSTATPEEVRKLLADLGSDDFDTREAASKALIAIGEPAMKLLQQARTTSKDPEVRRRAEEVLHEIGEPLEIEREKKLRATLEKIGSSFITHDPAAPPAAETLNALVDFKAIDTALASDTRAGREKAVGESEYVFEALLRGMIDAGGKSTHELRSYPKPEQRIGFSLWARVKREDGSYLDLNIDGGEGGSGVEIRVTRQGSLRETVLYPPERKEEPLRDQFPRD